MTIDIIKLAESIETALLERVANKDIGDYTIDINHDDYRLDICFTKIKPVKHVKCSIKVGALRGKEEDNETPDTA